MGSFLKRKKMKKIGCTLLAALLGTAVANAALIGEYTFNDTGDGFNTGPYGTITTRRWMEDLSVKGNYVSGVDGLVEIK